MSIKVKNYSDVDISNIQFSDPKKTRAGSYLVEMYLKNGNKKENIYIQTPKLRNISGINISENRASLEFEFSEKKPDFYDFFVKTDEKCILTAHKNSKKWFKQSFPLDVIDEFYKSNIKPGRNNNFPTIRVKIPVSKRQIKAEFYNYKRERINPKDINEDDELVSVIHVIGMKFLKQQFILETQLIQCKVCKKEEEQKSLGYIINDPDSDYEYDNEEYLIPYPEEINEIEFQDENNELISENNELISENNELISENNEEVSENNEEVSENNGGESESNKEELENNGELENNKEESESNKEKLENNGELENNEEELENNEEELENNGELENNEEESENNGELENNEEELENNVETGTTEILLDDKDIAEIDIESLDMEQELTFEDKNNIKEELNNISSKKERILNKRRKKINDIERQLEIKNQELENLKRDQEIFEDPNYEYRTDDEILDDEILNYQ